MPFTTPMAYTRISPYSKRSSTLSSVGPSKILTASSNAMLCWAMFRRFFLGPNCNSWRHIYIMYLRRRKAQSHRRHPRHPAIGRAALHAVDSNMSLRPVKRLIKAKPTLEGAGVHLRRAFGFGNTSEFDPFLLLDDFRNDIPEDYLAGFPWPPHRGIETITYVLAGTVELSRIEFRMTNVHQAELNS